jgi:hypothetical protein
MLAAFDAAYPRITCRDKFVALGVRQAPAAPATPAAPIEPPAATVDWLDPVVVRVSASGRPVNKSGAFIAMNRAIDTHGVLAAWKRARR